MQRASEGKQIYRCPYCEELFADGDKLGKHIVSTHWGKSNRSSNQGANESVIEQPGQEVLFVLFHLSFRTGGKMRRNLLKS